MSSLPPDDPRHSQIAVIGLAGRFPGAPTVERFWQNLTAGIESISTFSDEELRAAGVPAEDLASPSYVKASGVLDGIDLFDPDFFGFSQREAEITDPQQRLFLECAWEALEDAGHAPGRFAGPIGIYAGTSVSTYLLEFLQRSEEARRIGRFRTMLGNDKDFLSTWVSYKLDLRGPSVTVQTACSTSLVAVHLACQSLLNHECDMALAGGITVSALQRWGYMFLEGGIHSPDGHCRAFDAQAQGTVPGNGVGVVTLRRLADAIADGDPIRAVILGSAVNNDGSLKVGFTAPSVEGQARVIAEALGVAGVDPASIDYVEAHGTGTPLGDPIEAQALEEGFRAAGASASACLIGSVKTNVGHLDAAAGVAGLIKTVLALERGFLPPSLHFSAPNPRIDFARAGLRVNTRLERWQHPGRPRRAGVSSFGIGGTNAHLILEEAPSAALPDPAGPPLPCEMLVVSARSAAAVEQACANLALHLRDRPELELGDVAFTLQAGRRELAHRRAVVCRDREEAVAALSSRRRLAGPPDGVTGEESAVFMFPGQGAQIAGAATGLYHLYPLFRAEIDFCADVLAPELGQDLREVLFPRPEDRERAVKILRNTAFAQPALFSLEYALARLWMSWGVQPEAMIGHSLGEYVAACLAGVFSLPDGLALVAERGHRIARQPAGAMLAVGLDEVRTRERLDDELSLAAVNGPARCVVSGSETAIAGLAARLSAEGIAAKTLPTSHPFHSRLLEGAVPPFVERVARTPLSPPRIPYLSNVSGTWVTEEQATSPEYWGRHVPATVRFGDGLGLLAERPRRILLEVGPGETLTALVRGWAGLGMTAIPSLEHAGREDGGPLSILGAAGRLWCAGLPLDWRALRGPGRRRVSLPTYPFERRRCWVATKTQAAALPPASPESRDSTIMNRSVIPSEMRRAAIADVLRSVIHGLVGIDANEVDFDRPFLELGVDSLLLIQLSQEVKRQTGISLSLGELLENLGTVTAVAEALDARLPSDFGRPVEEPEATPAPPITTPTAVVPVQSLVTPPVPASGASEDLRGLFERQLQAMSGLMSQQLDLLRQASSAAISVPEPAMPGVTPAAPKLAVAATVAVPPPSPLSTGGRESGVDREVFVPFQKIEPGAPARLSPTQQQHLDALIRHADARLAESKRRTEKYRKPLADNRNSVGFRLLWKEMAYPILAQRSAGSRVWDVDGNEYIDIAMGFGVYLFGHSPDFVTDALRAQLDRGIQIGPQSDLAGEVAEELCRLTGVERVAFSNSGTEAVMVAVRLARAVTGRFKVAMFAGSYHGTADSILARGVRLGNRIQTVPMAPGVTEGAVEGLVLLDYGSSAALEQIRILGDELAAVLVEPVQGRLPEIQPREFLHELRRLTALSGTALIFDEVVTGFRCHPGGAQGWFDIRADIVTYGKVLGGGMPIGVVAGQATYLDAIDGGDWHFGDTSYPRADKTMFAGTFCKHPLAMAAARAVLQHFHREGPGLQQRLNTRTAEFVRSLNRDLATAGFPLHFTHFGSQFRLVPEGNDPLHALLPFHLLKNGLYVWEGNTCFLSTAHSDSDIARIHEAVLVSCAEMRQAGFFPASPGHAATAPAWTEVALTEGQKELWVLSRLGPEVSRAYNEAIVLKLRGDLDIGALRGALDRLIARHQILRATVSPDGERLRIAPHFAVDLPLTDFGLATDAEAGPLLDRWLKEAAGTPLDLERGPLLRVRVARLPKAHWLLIAVHHIAVDGVSYGVLLDNLSRLYLEERGGRAAALGPATPFAEYVRTQSPSGPETDRQMEDDERYWTALYADGIPPLELPASRPRPAGPTFNVERYSASFPDDLSPALQELSVRHSATLFTTLLTAFHMLLSEITGQHDLVVGIAAAGQVAEGLHDLIGYCVNPLCLRTRVNTGDSFPDALKAVKRSVLQGFEHQRYPLGKLLRKLGLRRSAGPGPLMPVVFNLDRTSSPRFADLETEMSTVPTGAKSELYWSLIETAGRLELECDYNPDLFVRWTIEGWAHRYGALLRRLTANVPLAGNLQGPEWLGLTDSQRHFWVGHNLRPELPLFNEVGTFTIRLAVDAGLLGRAAREIMATSDILHTVFELIGGVPHQRIQLAMPLEVEMVDLSALPNPERKVAEWIDQRRGAQLDLSRRLVDTALIKVDGGTYVWYQNIHHILADGLSHTILFAAIAGRYAQLLAGDAAGVKPLPPFRPYLEQQLALQSSAEHAQAVAYWQQELASPAPPLRFYGRARDPFATGAKRVRVELGVPRSRRLRDLALALQPGQGSEDRKVFQLFGALLATYLWRISGETSLSIGAPFHNRLTSLAKETVGLFMVILPLRIGIDGAENISTVLEKFAGKWRDALRHRSHAVENRLREPVYEVMLNVHKMKAPAFLGSPTELRWIVPDNLLESLALQVWDLGDRFVLELDLRLALFPETSHDRDLGHFVRLIDGVLGDSALPLGSLALLSEAERSELTGGIMRRRRDFPVARSFTDLFEERVRAGSGDTALVSSTATLTYDELNRRANRMAGHLRAAGAGPEVVVSLLAERSIDLWVAVLAVLKTGAAFLPLDPSHPAARLRQVLDGSRSPIVLVSRKLGGALDEALQGATAEAAPRVFELEELLARRGPEDDVPRSALPSALAYVIYTSGSTGTPKGVMIEQRGMINHLFCKIEGFGIGAADVVAQTASQCFDISVWQLLAPLLAGARVYVAGDDEAQDAARLLRALSEQRVTVAETVPSMLGAILIAARAASPVVDLSSLRWMICNGEALPPAHCAAWLSLYPGVAMANIYGATETSDDVTHQLLTQPPAADRPVPVGAPLPNIGVYVMMGIEAQPAGAPGEVCAAGICVGRGYLNDPVRTAEVFCPDPLSADPGARLYRLGDLGRFREDGALEVLGRLDHQVKVRGYRIELQEIESALAAHPALAEAAVVAREDERGETCLAAYFVPRPENTTAPPTVTELRRFLRRSLSDAMIPASFMALAAFPLNTSGKVDRRALPAPSAERPLLESDYAAPSNETERQLAEIWKAVLGVERVGIHDNFFELGGDSILSLQVASQAAQSCLRFDALAIFSQPTIAELALSVVRSGDAPQAVGTAAPQAAEDRAHETSDVDTIPLTPIQRWFFELGLPNPHHFNQEVLLTTAEPVQLRRLEAVWQAVARRHDALHLRFIPAEGGWRQVIPGERGERTGAVSMIDLAALPEARQKGAIESAADAVQAGLHLSAGPLARCVAFDLGLGKPGRLLWVIHHLAVDGVTWRILLEEVHTAYHQLESGQPVELPATTLPFADWARRLDAYARSRAIETELGYWLRPYPLDAGPLPVDDPAGRNTEESTRSFSVALTPAETRALLQDVPTAFKTQINDALMAALALAVAGWSGRRAVLISLEGHGRERIDEPADVTRTAGWFTSLFPVLIELGAPDDPVEKVLQRVHDQLAALPNRGIGYGLLRHSRGDHALRQRLADRPQPEISFNYLGQTDNVLPRAARWAGAAESSGRVRAPGGQRLQRLEVNSVVSGGELQLHWSYSASLHRRATMERLAQAMLAALRALVGRAQEMIAGEFSAADFAEFDWSQKDVNEIAAAINKAGERRKAADRDL